MSFCVVTAAQRPAFPPARDFLCRDATSMSERLTRISTAPSVDLSPDSRDGYENGKPALVERSLAQLPTHFGVRSCRRLRKRRFRGPNSRASRAIDTRAMRCAYSRFDAAIESE